jgi:hypothetical protein
MLQPMTLLSERNQPLGIAKIPELGFNLRIKENELFSVFDSLPNSSLKN